MRKLLFFPFLLLALTATACSGDPIEPEGSATEQPETPGNDNDEDETPDNDGRYLVLYCSRTSNTEGVAQRIGTIRSADKIIVLDEGKIAGMGRHEDLIKNCEVYRQIALSQLSKEELA